MSTTHQPYDASQRDPAYPEDATEALRVLRATINAAYAHLTSGETIDRVVLTTALMIAQGRFDSLADAVLDVAAEGVRSGTFAGVDAFDRALRDAGVE